MRLTTIAVSAALALGTPALAQQSAAEQRMFEAQQQAREIELRQRVEQVERNVENLDLRLKSEQNLRDMRTAPVQGGPAFPQIQYALPFLTTQPGNTARRPLTQDEVQAAELAAGNARLRALAQPAR